MGDCVLLSHDYNVTPFCSNKLYKKYCKTECKTLYLCYSILYNLHKVIKQINAYTNSAKYAMFIHSYHTIFMCKLINIRCVGSFSLAIISMS